MEEEYNVLAYDGTESSCDKQYTKIYTMNEDIVVIAKYDNDGKPMYQGKDGAIVSLLLDALKFNTHTEAKYYHEKVMGNTNCITERTVYVHQSIQI